MSKVSTIDWDAIKHKLYLGRDEIGEPGRGTHLTPGECRILLDVLTGDLKPKRKRGKKPQDFHFRDRAISELCALYEARDCGKTESAVRAVMEVFGVKRDTVFKARREHPTAKSMYNKQFDDELIREIEQEWRRLSP
jgi:hypothetical protein